MFHTEEVELILPEKINEGEEVPFLLGLGPGVTMIIPIGLMVMLSGYIYGENGSRFMLVSLVMTGSTCITGIIWSILNRAYKKKSIKRKKQIKYDEYIKYLDIMRNRLKEYSNDNRQYMLERYPSVSRDIKLFSNRKRDQMDDDFYFLRLGIGECPFQVNIKLVNDKKEMFRSEEYVLADKLIDEFRVLKNVPVGIDIRNTKALGIVGESNTRNIYEHILHIIAKIACAYSEKNMKICLLYDEKDSNHIWLYERIKFLPHVFAFSENKRLAAGNKKDLLYFAQDICENVNSNNWTVIVLDEQIIDGEALKEILYGDNVNDQVFSITLAYDIHKIINYCKKILFMPGVGTNNAYVCNSNNIDEHYLEFAIDEFNESYFKNLDFEIRSGFNYFYNQIQNVERVPDFVSLLELYDSKLVEDINISEMWSRNYPEINMCFPIGMCEKKLKLNLDLSEKIHGPHGLIAGTTGSGKSELIQTMLISLCLSFSPREVNFFIIDYKGGGTGNIIGSLPHCAGSISNLSGNNIKRALSAISYENELRQQILLSAGVNHIDAYMQLYRQGKVNKVLPHLILIIDEFAELRKEEPEFMQEIISISALGRSLGIHLILATQKPAGVVDDKIWSNSRFRLCLKVQDRQDSMGMLHRPDAALLKKSGQCYIQIGNNEYFKFFQTAYCGESYTNLDKKKNKASLVNQNGERIEDEIINNNDDNTLLNYLVEHIKIVAIKHEYSNAKSLWINELSTNIDLPENCGLHNQNAIPLGIYDDPSCQEQNEFYYIPDVNGHMAIAGGPGTGKSNAIEVILNGITKYQFILVDINNNLSDYSKWSNCIGVLSDKENIDIFFYHMKKIFKKYSKPVFIIIDNFGQFYRCLSQNQAEILQRYFSEGIGNNIFFIISGTISSEFPGKIFLKIKTTLCLEMNDKYQYGDIMRQYHIGVYPKGGIPGRCLYKINNKILEAQIYKVKGPDLLRNNEKGNGIVYEISKVPFIPIESNYVQLLNTYKLKYSDDAVIPIGYSLVSGFIRGVNIRTPGCFIISGDSPGSTRNLMSNIQMSLKTTENIYMKNVVIIEDINSVDTSYALELESKFLIIQIDSLNQSISPLNPLYRRVIEQNQGIHIGGNVAGQKNIRFDDLSYIESNAKLPVNIGLMKIREKSNTIRVYIPHYDKEVIADDYD